MRLIQYYLQGQGRRVGRVEGDQVVDLTSVNEAWTCLHDLFFEARRAGQSLTTYVTQANDRRSEVLPYPPLLSSHPGDSSSWLLPPLDHPDPAHCLISGTGLTHLGSMERRAQMHSDAKEEAKTDSQRIFEMGLAAGKPEDGIRGVQPEWFYKGNGTLLRGHNAFLDIPSFTEDGGEEPELVGCYIVDAKGVPHRLGFAIGNEWSDHRMERVNYLWLAPSKMRTCSIGPELVTDARFKDLRGCCRILRRRQELYHSGELLTGEDHMSHSLANLEDHHFKYPQHRVPGDVHLHYFGTMQLSYPDRPFFQTGDRIEIAFTGMGAPLANHVRKHATSSTPVTVQPC